MSQNQKEKAAPKRKILINFTEVVTYSVPVETSLTNKELQAIHDDDDAWFALVESVPKWHIKHIIGVSDRTLDAMYDAQGLPVDLILENEEEV